MSPELSRRLARVIHLTQPDPETRVKIIRAAEVAAAFDQLPDWLQKRITEAEGRTLATRSENKQAGARRIRLILTKDAVGGHHVPGTPFNWRHEWEPLNAQTARAHGLPWADKKPAAPKVEAAKPVAPPTPKAKPKRPLPQTADIKNKQIRETVDSALRKVPALLRDPELKVRVQSGTNRRSPGMAAEYRGGTVIIYEKTFKDVLSGRLKVDGPEKGMTPDQLAEHTIVHELGHGVMAGMWNNQKFLGRLGKDTRRFGPQAMRDAFDELRFVTSYASTHPDEAWAEAFMIRLHDPKRSFGPKSEAIFKELGI